MVPSLLKSSEWSKVTLGDLVVESAFGPRFSSDLYCVNGNIGTVRTTDLDLEGVINYKTIPYATLPIDNFKNHILKTGDLLITRSGTCGIPCLFTEQEKPIIAGAFLIRFILKDNIEPIFLHMLLKEPSVKNKIDEMASGGVQKNLTGTNLKKLKLKIPLKNEQRKITQILSVWENAIRVTESLIKNSKQQKKSLMQQLLMGKKRFSGFEEEWRKSHLGDIAKIGKGKALSSRHIETGAFPVIAGGKTSPYNHSKFTHKNVITISASGAYAGYVAFHSHKIWASDCSVIEGKKDIDISYIYQFMLLNQHKIYSLQSGGAQPHIYPKDLATLKIKVPPLKEQQKIALVLTCIFWLNLNTHSDPS
jgi:type I restriction enzyme S subunit